MYWFSFSVISTVIAGAAAARSSANLGSWGLQNFTSLVAFGDSYTDESRYSYFSEHNGTAPPVGWVDPEVEPISRTACSCTLLKYDLELLCLRRGHHMGSLGSYLHRRQSLQLRRFWRSLLQLFNAPAHLWRLRLPSSRTI